MPALQGHPRKDESFDIGEKKKNQTRPLRNAVTVVQGWPKAQGKRLRLHPLKVDQYC